MESATAAARATRPRALDAATLCEAFQLTAADYADRPALRLMDSEFECKWGEFAATVRRRAAAFAALGIGRGDSVGFILVNRPALHLCDAAAMHLGATCFSIYNTSSVEQVEYVVSDAANRVVVTEPQCLDRLREVRERVDTLEHIVVIGDAPAGTLSVAESEALGDDAFDFDAAWRSVEPDDVLCLIYTSGTTGPPKGVQLTHGNMMAEWRALAEVVDLNPAGRSISFLPTAHIGDRWAHLYGSMVYGHTVHCCPDPRAMVAYSIAVKPTVWGGVPRIWEKLKAALQAGFAGEPDEARRQAIAGALEIGAPAREGEAGGDGVRRAGAALAGRRRAGALEDPRLARARRVRMVRGRRGADPARGGPLLRRDRDRDRRAVGDVRDHRGGDAQPARADPRRHRRTAAAGHRAGAGARRRDPRARADHHDGLPQHARQDGRGAQRRRVALDRRRRRDRRRRLPQDRRSQEGADHQRRRQEHVAGQHRGQDQGRLPAVAQVVAIGDRRPYNVALVTLDPDACGAFAARHGLRDPSPAAMARADVVREAVAAGVEAGNAALSRVEQIKKFKLIEGEWEPGGDELTPTMKLKRKPIGEKYAPQIEALYDG